MSVADRVPAANAVLPIGALAIGVLVWWLVVAVFAVPSFLLPTPTAVAAQFVNAPLLYARNGQITLRRVLLGGGVGVVSGFCIAVAVVHVPWVRRAVYPYLVTARVLPKIAIAPILLLYLGTGATTAFVFVALIAFFPMVESTAAGLDGVPDRYLDLLESVNVGPLRAFLAVRLPYALPDVFAGVKQSMTLAVIGAVIAEWIVATDGLGALIIFASENVQPAVILAALVVLVVEGLGLYAAVTLVQRSVLWNAPNR